MRIAIIGQKGIPARYGGVEKHVEGLATGLAKAGHEVYVYTRPYYTSKEITEYKGVKLIGLPTVFTKHLDAISHTFLACLDVIFIRKPDVVHFHAIGPCSLIWFVKLFRPKIQVIATFHCRDYFHKKWSFPARLFLKFGEFVCCKMADKVIAVSQELKKYAQEKYGIEAVYIPNAIEIRKKSKVGTEQFGYEKGEYILAVSRLIKHKGIHYLIDAFNNLKTEKKLVIVGEGSFTDDYVRELKSLAGENKSIIFTGAKSGAELEAIFKNAYCFIQPSISEGLSMAILEAMSYGLPVLVSDIPENKEAIGNAGFIFKAGNSEDLKNKIKFLLENPDIAEKQGRLARRRAENEYNLEDTIKNICKLYAVREKFFTPRQLKFKI